MTGTIRREIVIPQPREEVWRGAHRVERIPATSICGRGFGDRLPWIVPPVPTGHPKVNPHNTMNQGTKRSVLRWIHIVFALPMLGYIYGPPSETLQYLPYFRFIYLPVDLMTGFWMWKGHVIRRLFSKRSD